jgi:hypothetical protein
MRIIELENRCTGNRGFESHPLRQQYAELIFKICATMAMRARKADADTAKVVTMDEARRIASNIAKLPGLLKGKDT